MVNELKYIIKDVVQRLTEDIKSSGKLIEKPREILKGIIFFFVVALMTKQYALVKLCVVLYTVVYVWLIVKQERWKGWMREDVKKRAREEHLRKKRARDKKLI